MWPHVQVNQVDQRQGESKEIERVLLFVGKGKNAMGETRPINTQTDLDALLGAEANPLKSNIKAAMANAGQNWFAYVHVLPENAADTAFVDAVLTAQSVASVEGYVYIGETSKATIKAAQTLRATLLAKFGRWTWGMLSVVGLQEAETWQKALTRLSVLQKGETEASIQLVPVLWGNEAGVLAGRLCHQSVTIADSPARVQTGALIDLGRSDFPKDSEGVNIDLATLQALEKMRFSVPMWYPDYDGLYWSEGRTLSVEGGDFQAIENLRIVDKVARRVRLQAIAKIGDRSLNSTPNSIESHKSYFSRTMREMARSTEINGVTFPGECQPPQEGDVAIVWKTKNTVDIYITVRTYACPKGITVSILLDAKLEANQ
ncbi:DUF2586 domain-containing protein [Arsenophonus nasoniae]|uniref:DUF2586 domain-containing protein n=1 Tax=Arsenophonus nasoniae TaxID=638 RepID=A0A4P7KX17_9GAMM|nr:DUF2586 domain-containing protein [Arsenophonus nasoniae]QBY41988.1 hypothetical protein ArsFIN_05210 [Arsenophonus nasoniae]WGM06185.1 DUF2586 domain-containing protein [Arsenophonus nasoniae]